MKFEEWPVFLAICIIMMAAAMYFAAMAYPVQVRNVYGDKKMRIPRQGDISWTRK